MADKPDLIALLGSRICHDLISPIGAIDNGVELLMMGGSVKGPEVALIAESVAHASARIRYFRIAFGLSTEGQRIGRAEVMSILSDLTRGTRLQVHWNGPTDLERREVKLAFLMIQCLESAMAYGGRIHVTRAETHWALEAEATKLRIEPDLWALLTDPAATFDVSAAQVHFALLAAELAGQDRPMTLSITETGIVMGF